MICDRLSNTTICLFGPGQEDRVGEMIRGRGRRVLVHFGSDRVISSGLMARVTGSLTAAGLSPTLLGGVVPNPRDDLVRDGIALCLRERIDFVLAVGGGSVIDSAKAIAVGAATEADLLDIFETRHSPAGALGIGAIPTMAGSGSESSPATVISFIGNSRKIAYVSDLIRPAFAILNPELTASVSPRLTACGIVDAMSHVFECYFTSTPEVECTDGICEGLLRTLIRHGLQALAEPENLDHRSQILLASKYAQDGTCKFGRKEDGSCHKIVHELGALWDVNHGAALGIVGPAWMRFVRQTDPARFARLATNVFGVSGERWSDETLADEAIGRYEAFLGTLGMPRRLRDIGVDTSSLFPAVARSCVKTMASGTIGNFRRISSGDIEAILAAVF
jgi:alcohol dehydrogenase YqhD (iron-dependent ADH family)